MAKYLTKARAQEICSNWHGGQWSALYSYASSGNYTKGYDYLKEISEDLNPDPARASRHVYTSRERQELTSLKNYFTKLSKN